MRTLTADDARRFLVAHHGLRAAYPERGAAGLRALLADRRCLQLDPLDRIGTNADLVALARVDGVRKGDVYRHLLGGDVGFEHFAKQRCILPADRFPNYRARALAEPGFQQTDQMRKIINQPCRLCMRFDYLAIFQMQHQRQPACLPAAHLMKTALGHASQNSFYKFTIASWIIKVVTITQAFWHPESLNGPRINPIGQFMQPAPVTAKLLPGRHAWQAAILTECVNPKQWQAAPHLCVEW